MLSNDELISDTESVGEAEFAAAKEKEGDDVSMKSDNAEAELIKAEEYKARGNDFFKSKDALFLYLSIDSKFDDAIDQYTEAIYCKIPNDKKAVYYCNRSIAKLRLEDNTGALFDAFECIKLDKTNVKGYYRKGQAYVSMRKLKEATDAFLQVCKMQPKNADARSKYELTKKEYREQLLAAAVMVEQKKISLNENDIVVEGSYSGPKLDSIDDVTPEWVEKLMEWQRDGKNLHKKYAVMIINKASEIFDKVDSLVDIHIDELEEVTVCGDIHGQYFDLLNIFKINGSPSTENPYLFNGDFIDRGSFAVEVIMTMLAWKVALPQHFFMSRGNHEAK